MSFIDKIFRKKTAVTDQNSNSQIRVFDKFGREYFIDKKQWRNKILPDNIKENWNNADGLFAVIYDALQSDFIEDVQKASEQLYRIDKDIVRGVCIRAIVLMKLDQLDKAEQVLRLYLNRYGEEGSVLTNLAKIYASRGQLQEVDEMLWHALEIDPNQDNGLGWFVALARERHGEAAALAATHRAAAIKGSWRAPLLLAAQALQQKNKVQALEYFHQSLAQAPRPVPPDLLMEISGDLGKHGYLQESISLTRPYFDAQIHGLRVGNNLIKANLELKNVEAAQEIKEQLYAQKRLDWKEHLSYWDHEIAKAKLDKKPVDKTARPQITMLAIDAPVWLAPTSPMAALSPQKQENALRICFLGSSAEAENEPKQAVRQLTDAPGQLSRALPLFLAEQATFTSQAKACAMIPCMAGENKGFVLAGAPFSEEQAIRYVGESDYIVVTHLKCKSLPWSVETRLIRSRDSKCVNEFFCAVNPEKPDKAILQLTQKVLSLLQKEAQVALCPTPDWYQIPNDPELSRYLGVLGQSLGVRYAVNDDAVSDFLYGEWDIIDNQLQLCLALPDKLVPRIVFAHTLAGMKRLHPEILTGFEERINLLQSQYPLVGVEWEMTKRIISETMA